MRNILFKNKQKTMKSSLTALLNKEITFLTPGFSSRRKQELFADLFMLLESGIDISSCFEIIESAFQKKALKDIVSAIHSDLLRGSSLADAFEKTKKFNEYECQGIRIGEETGRLNDVLRELSVYYKDRIELQRKITGALSYPAIIVLVATLVVYFMLSFIVPMFEDVFHRFGKELPPLTLMVIRISHGFGNSFIFVVGVILALSAFGWYSRKQEWYRKYTSYTLLRVPLIGNIIRKVYMARLCLGMELLLGSYVPLLRAVQLSRRMVQFRPIQDALQQIEEGILKGRPLHQTMQQCKIFDRRMIAMIRVAEETNRLNQVFARMKDQYTDEVSHQTTILSSLLEPVIIIIIGLFVAVILMSMYLPMFQMNSATF